MLVFTDLETTGLTPNKCSLLEVAAIVTDDALNEVARYEKTVRHPDSATIVAMIADGKSSQDIGARFSIDPYVIEMHDKNGLWIECMRGAPVATIDLELWDFIRRNAVCMVTRPDEKHGQVTTAEYPQLAGSTISFDRGFIEFHLPKTLKVLHYRNVDVSTLNETARRFWPTVYAGRPDAGKKKEDLAHRGMVDIQTSIDVYRYYLANIGPIVSAPAALVEQVVESCNNTLREERR